MENEVISLYSRVQELAWESWGIIMKDRETPCLYYICKGNCKKGREAEHTGYCQRCDKYKPRVRERHLNRKKQYLDKLRRFDKGE